MTTQTIPKGWAVTTLGEVAEIIGGGTPKTNVAEYWNGDISWLSVVDFNNDSRWVCQTEKRITQSGLENSSTKLLNAGDLIISARGTVGAFAQLKYPMAFNQSCYGLRAKDNSCNDFLYCLLKQNNEQFKKNVHGAVFDTITRQTFDQINILLPPLPEQRAIAAVLSSLDDKIELLRRNNKTLEGIAQALFKRWFVDFEFLAEIIKNSPPVKEGWQTKSDGVVNNKKSLKTFRKKLRNNLTPAEAKLWTYLQNSKLDGRKFRRQHSVDNYILDFYCPSEKLAVELDGEVHNNPIQAEYDYERDLFLRYYGIKVLRFENKLVFENPDYLLNRIREAFGKQSLPPTTPPFGHPSLPGGEFLGYKSSGGKMIDSELGKIPEGWKIKGLSAIANFLNGLAMQKFPPESESNYLPVVKIRELKSGITDQTDKATKNLDKKYIVGNGDILFSWSGSLEVVIWEYGKGALNQHLFKVTSDKYLKWFYYFWILEHLPHFRGIASDKATTMGHIQRHHLDEALVCIPDDNLMGVANRTFMPMLQKVICNNSQIQTLSRLRDSLLPKLMKGEVRVKGFCKGE